MMSVPPVEPFCRITQPYTAPLTTPAATGPRMAEEPES